MCEHTFICICLDACVVIIMLGCEVLPFNSSKQFNCCFRLLFCVALSCCFLVCVLVLIVALCGNAPECCCRSEVLHLMLYSVAHVEHALRHDSLRFRPNKLHTSMTVMQDFLVVAGGTKFWKRSTSLRTWQ
jgi:hypothetical protein